MNPDQSFTSADWLSLIAAACLCSAIALAAAPLCIIACLKNSGQPALGNIVLFQQRLQPHLRERRHVLQEFAGGVQDDLKLGLHVDVPALGKHLERVFARRAHVHRVTPTTPMWLRGWVVNCRVERDPALAARTQEILVDGVQDVELEPEGRQPRAIAR